MCSSDLVLKEELATEERWLTSTTFWTWKENCGAAGWGIYAGVYGDSGDQRCSYDRPAPDPSPKPTDGGLRKARAALLMRGCPRAVAGTLLSYAYDPASGSFTMLAEASHRVALGTQDRETIVYVPPRASGAVRVAGAARLDRIVAAPGGGRFVYVAPTGGRYSVRS